MVALHFSKFRHSAQLSFLFLFIFIWIARGWDNCRHHVSYCPVRTLDLDLDLPNFPYKAWVDPGEGSFTCQKTSPQFRLSKRRPIQVNYCDCELESGHGLHVHKYAFFIQCNFCIPTFCFIFVFILEYKQLPF